MILPGPARALPRYLLTALLGGAFALALYQVWSLEGRWFVVAVVGVALVGMSMVFAGRFSDFLLVMLLFCVPLAGFAKWSFLPEYPEPTQEAALYTGTLGIGITDFLLAGMYVAWAGRIFVLRTEPLPRLMKLDFWVGMLVLACVLSLWGARLKLGLFALEHLLKHVLVYFYVSRHFGRRHVPWLLASIAFAITAEAALGVAQFFNVIPPGLILDKGAGSDLLEKQYRVPGIEDISRATGSLYDSHALGGYLAMLAPFTLVFLYQKGIARGWRLACVALLGLAFAAVVVTYSRSGWLSIGFAIAVVLAVLISWKEKGVVPSILAGIVAAVLTAPWVFMKLFGRFFDAPTELVTVRFEQYPVAWIIWSRHFLFGTGAGNYMEQMDLDNINWSLPEPVHNVPLFIAAETGLFGLIAYYGLFAVTVHRLWTVMRTSDDPWRRIALAALAGLLSYFFDGMSNPLFREPTVYMMFWIIVSLSVALTLEARRDSDPVRWKASVP